MTPDRFRGYQLYALVAAVLIAGGVWYLRSAPYLGDDPRLAGWRATVARDLPDVPEQAAADTVLLGAGTELEAGTTVRGGAFALTMVCAGLGQVRVRLSSQRSNDTGKAVVCTDRPELVTLPIGLGTSFYMSIDSETAAAVFRWRLMPVASY